MKLENREIFEKIGYLLYAIAADQHVKPLEVAELKLLISERWLPRNYKGNESIVSDETHFIMTAMDELAAGNVSASQAFLEFSGFNSLYPSVFTKELQQNITKTCEDIIAVFHADNPGENDHFEALKKLWQVNVLKAV